MFVVSSIYNVQRYHEYHESLSFERETPAVNYDSSGRSYVKTIRLYGTRILIFYVNILYVMNMEKKNI